MTLTSKPSTPLEIGGIGHSVKRHEDDRFIAGQGTYPRRPHAARHAAHGDPAFAGPARAHRLDRHVRGERARRRRRRRHRRTARAVQPRVDADDVGRHPGGARHRQGAVPGPGGRGGRRHRSLHRGGRARAHRRRLRHAAGHHVAAAVARRRHGAHPRRQGGPDLQPRLRVGVRRRGRDRGRVRQGRPGRLARDALPAFAPGAARDVRHPRRRQLDDGPGDDLHDVAGAAREPHRVRDGRGAARAEHPDHQPRHRRRLRQQGAGVPGVRGRDRGVARDRPAGEVDREPHREPHLHRVRTRLLHEGRARAHQRGPHPRAAREDALGPGRVLRRRATDEVPRRALPRRHRQLRLPGRAREVPRRVHQQGAGRRRVPVFVPHHRGVVPHRAAGADRGVRARHRSRRDAVQELHPARAVPVHDADRLRVRLRRLPDRVAQGDRRGRLRGRCAPSRRRRAPRAGSSASASRTSPRRSARGRRRSTTSSA